MLPKKLIISTVLLLGIFFSIVLFPAIGYSQSGQGIFIIPSCSSISNPAVYGSWCLTGNSGTPYIAVYNGSSYQLVSTGTVHNDTNVTGTISTSGLTLGWSGTLAAGRLNSQVVQAVTSDTNVTGSINAQNLTLGWSGQLAASRLNSNVVQVVTNDTNVTGTISAQNLTLGWTGLLNITRGGTGNDFGPLNIILDVPNDNFIGTLDYGLVKIVNDSGNARARMTAITDTYGAIGLCNATAASYGGSCGTSNDAYIKLDGLAYCQFDGIATPADYIQISSSVAGNCTDAGAALPTNGHEVIGIVGANCSTCGTNIYAINISPIIANGGGGGGGSGTVTSITAGTGLTGGTITTNGTIALSTPVATTNGGTGTNYGAPNVIYSVANDTNTGTTNFYLAKFITEGTISNQFSHAIITSAGDTSNAMGVVISGGGTAGSASLQVAGKTTVYADEGVPAGDYAIQSTSVNGAITDGGLTCPTNGQQVIGVNLNTTHSAGTTGLLLKNPCGGGGGSGTVTSITAGNGLVGGTITSNGTIALNTPVSIVNGGTGNTFGPLNTILSVPNDPTIGTLDYGLVKIVNDSGNARAEMTATTDTYGAIGICNASYLTYGGTCGTSNNAYIKLNGLAACQFDGMATVGDYIQISSSVAGNCTDVGATLPTNGKELIGIVGASCPSCGTNIYTINILPLIASESGNGTVTSISAGTGLTGGTITSSGTINLSTPVLTTLGGTGTNYGAPADFFQLANASSGGTVLNKLVSISGSPSKAIHATGNTLVGAVGICVSGCGNSGTATIQITGLASCIFDSGGSVAGDYVGISTLAPGDCADAGSTYPPTNGQQIFGQVLSTNSGTGTYSIILNPGSTFNGISLPISAMNGGTGTNYGPSYIFSQVTNNSSAPSTNHLVKFVGAPSSVTNTATTDTLGAVGICLSNCGISGSSIIQIMGLSSCAFDNAGPGTSGGTIAGDYIQISSSISGDCHDAGSSYPTANQVIGQVLTTNTGAGTYLVNLFSPGIVANSGGGGSGTVTSITAGTGLIGGTITSSGTISLNTPTATTLGGIESYVAVTNQWINAISTAGVPSSTQPAFSNISGTISTAQEPNTTVNSVANGTNVTGSISAQVLTLGWTGQLAISSGGTGAAVTSQNFAFIGPSSGSGAPGFRLLVTGDLPSSVATSVTNDTNVTGSITAQNLTLGWTGTLGVTRGGLNTSTAPSSGQLPIAQSSSVYAPTTIIGDCSIASSGTITCIKTGGVAFGTFATQNYTTPPIIGGTTPNTIYASPFKGTGNGGTLDLTLTNPVLNGTSLNGASSADAFGCAGNGITDDSSCIVNCLNAGTGNGVCKLSPGKVYAVSQLVIPGGAKTLTSDNSYTTELLVTGNGGGTCNPNTTLNGGITLPVSSMVVVSTTGFPATGTIVVGPVPSRVLTYTSLDPTHFYFSGGSGGTGTIATGSYVYSPTNGGIISTGSYNTIENLVLATSNSSLDCILNTTAPDYNIGENSNFTLRNVAFETIGLSASTSNPTAWAIANMENVNVTGMNSISGNFKRIIYHDPAGGLPAGNSNAGVLYGFKMTGAFTVIPLSNNISGGIYNDANPAIELGNANATTISGLWCDGTLNCLHIYPALDGGNSIINPFAISNTIACQAWLPSKSYTSTGCVVPSATDQCNFTASSTNFSCVGSNHAIGQILWGIGAGTSGGIYNGQITAWNSNTNTGTLATAPSTSVNTANDTYVNAYAGHIYRDAAALTSGSSQPTFPTNSRGTVADGTGTWIEYGTGSWFTLEGAGTNITGGYFNAAPAVGIYLTNNTRGFSLSGAGLYAQPVAGVFCNGCNGVALTGNGWSGTGVFNFPLLQTSSVLGSVTGMFVSGNYNSSTGIYVPVYADGSTSGADFDDLPYFGGPGAFNWSTLSAGKLAINTYTLSGSNNYTGIQTDTSSNSVGSAISKVFCNSSSSLTETLPTATGSGRELTIKNINTGACTVDSGSGELIDGSRTFVLSSQYQSITIIDTATNQWYVE